MTGLVNAAGHLGLDARGIRAPLESLSKVPLPAIAHMSDPRGSAHFVVVYRVRAGSVVVMDPAGGEVKRLELSEFNAAWTGVLLLLAPRATARNSLKTPTSSLGRFLRLASPHRKAMGQAAIGAAAYTALGLGTAIFVEKIVDLVIPSGDRSLLHLLGVAMLLVVAAQVYVRASKDYLILRTGQSLDAALLQGYYEHLLHLPQRFFDTMRVGEIVSRLNDAVKIRHFLNEVAVDMVVHVFVLVFSFSLMTIYSWRLTLLVASTVPLYCFVYYFANRSNRRDQRLAMEAAADLEGHVVESVGAVRTIHALGLEAHAAVEGERRLVRFLRPIYDVGTTSILSGSCAELITRVLTVTVLWFGAVLVLNDALTPGELMSFYALNGYLAPPVLALIAANRQVQDAIVAADRLFDVLDLERESDHGVVPLASRSFDKILVHDVHFRYGSRPPVFRGLQLTIHPGQVTAIVGESGSGKSTLAAMLQRAHLPETGRILYGEVDIRYIKRESLIRAVALVPQDVMLFSGTVMENLAPGEAQPNLRRIAEALSSVGLHALEEELPLGLTTPIGERGYALSGGQRQRLGIARAFYRGPEVLILDEATSGLDSRSESIVQTSLRGFAERGGTVILITHRLTSAVLADTIVVLDQGKLAEEGRHDTLLQSAGLYRKLWDLQTRGFQRGQSISPISA